jgi:hypothetical protein
MQVQQPETTYLELRTALSLLQKHGSAAVRGGGDHGQREETVQLGTGVHESRPLVALLVKLFKNKSSRVCENG